MDSTWFPLSLLCWLLGDHDFPEASPKQSKAKLSMVSWRYLQAAASVSCSYLPLGEPKASSVGGLRGDQTDRSEKLVIATELAIGACTVSMHLHTGGEHYTDQTDRSDWKGQRGNRTPDPG